MSLWTRIGHAAWMMFLCIMTFVLTAALWINRTYGVLSLAVTNESFRNGLQNKRTLFVKYVILPTAVVFVILLVVHIVWKNMNRRNIGFVSAFLMLLSICAAGVILDAGTYLSRMYRLHQVQWYDTENSILHALGRIDDNNYTNSREALENGYQSGNRLFECDLIMTSDGQLVACHDWEYWNSTSNQNKSAENEGGEIPSFKEFMKCKIKGKYTPLSGDDIVLFLKEHSDVYIVTDTKYTDEEKVKEEFQTLVDVAKRNGCEETLNRFIVQIYRQNMYEMVNGIYPFPNYIYTLYQEDFGGEEDKMLEYAQFCMLHDIDVITMKAKYYQDGLSDICDRYDLRIFVHTVNEEDEIRAFREKGVGVYTDISL